MWRWQVTIDNFMLHPFSPIDLDPACEKARAIPVGTLPCAINEEPIG
jgi:hypothetical protein